MAKVSVIIPTYNRRDVIRRCLESLIYQTYQNFEVIVCDDGSTDDSESIVSEYYDLLNLRYDNADNFGGPARPRNRGIKMARGQYIAFLDSDDWWSPKKLEKSVKALDAGADLVYHDLYLIKSHMLKPRFWRRSRTRSLKNPVFNDLLFNGNGISNSSVVVRREFMERIEGFSEDNQLIAAEDYDAWLKIAKFSNGFLRLPECLGFYMVGNQNISSSMRAAVAINRILELYKNDYNNMNYFPKWANLSLAIIYFKNKEYLKSQFHATELLKKFPRIRFGIIGLVIIFKCLVLKFNHKIFLVFPRLRTIISRNINKYSK